MTTDERLDRLTERHEALSQSLELLAHDMQGLQTIVRTVVEKVDVLATTVANLALLAENHERRLQRLEGQ